LWQSFKTSFWRLRYRLEWKSFRRPGVRNSWTQTSDGILRLRLKFFLTILCHICYSKSTSEKRFFFCALF